jgi:hypothetical protein
MFRTLGWSLVGAAILVLGWFLLLRPASPPPTALIRVHLRLDGRPWSGPAEVLVTKQPGEGGPDRVETGKNGSRFSLTLTSTGSTRSGGEFILDGITRGRWVATIKPVPGFDPVPEKEVVVIPGGVHDVVFDLVRAD